jgi:hypothetical protein
MDEGNDSLHGQPSSLRRTQGTLSRARHIAMKQGSLFVHLYCVSGGKSSKAFRLHAQPELEAAEYLQRPLIDIIVRTGSAPGDPR